MKILERIFGPVSYAASALVALCAAYFVWGIGSGVISSWPSLPAADQLRFTANISMAGQLMLYASIAAAVSIGYINWMRAEIGFTLLFIFVVMYLGIPAGFDWWASQGAVWTHGRPGGLLAMFTALQNGAYAFMVSGIALVLRNLSTYISVRKVQSRHQTKHKLGEKAEQVRKDILLGKCWQLPYCVDFIRERCPIYINRASCWRHKVGCMCEERVIINAMEVNRSSGFTPLSVIRIPADSVLSPKAKRERCRNCIIYNHRQHQKYKVLLPVTLLVMGSCMYIFYTDMYNVVMNSLYQADVLISRLAFSPSGHKLTPLADMVAGSQFAVTFMTVVIFIILLSWALKLLETAVFEWKI
ncbi:MAG: hypothetical protein ACYC1M_11355 [Armatimonadota bacterium]